MNMLNPTAINRALDKINAKSNTAPKYTVHWRSPVTRSWQSSAEKTVLAAQKTARQLIKEGARDVSISAFEDGRAVDVPIKENPARKIRAVRVVAAKNPTKSSDVPGDFSQSSAKVYGRAWVDAKSAAVKDFGDVTQVKLIWSDGEWLQMLFDNKTAAINHLKRLGFSVNK